MMSIKDLNWVEGRRYAINGSTTCQEEYHYMELKTITIDIGEILVSTLLAIILILLAVVLVIYCLKSRGTILKKPLPYGIHYQHNPEEGGDCEEPRYAPCPKQPSRNNGMFN